MKNIKYLIHASFPFDGKMSSAGYFKNESFNFTDDSAEATWFEKDETDRIIERAKTLAPRWKFKVIDATSYFPARS